MQSFLELCLKSVKAATSHIDSEIIVVDNNSPDNSCKMVKTLFPEVILIENKQNSGFSKGNNLGVAKAKGEYLCILNPDTVVTENTFTTLLATAEKIPNLGILGCRLIDGTGQYLPESKRNVPLPRVALKKLLGNPNAYYANQITEFDKGEVPIFVGAFMIIKKEVYNAVGGFDEDYFMYGEDVDLSYKIYKKGYTNFYDGSTTIIHFKGESTLKDINYAKRFYGAMQIFYKKHFKSNFFFNKLVWLGIRIAFLLRKEPEIVKSNVKHHILVSNKVHSELTQVIAKKIHLVSDIKDLSEINENTEIILDGNTLSYNEIISCISDKKINSKAKFKIIPKNSNFIIGSNSSKNRGEVIFLNKN